MNRTIIYQPLLIAFLVLLFAQESKLISPINQCTPTTELTTARAITFFQQTKPNPGQLIMELENLLLGVKNSTSKIQLLNDLAATYFWRGQCERNFADIAHALSLIDQAIAIDQAPKTAPEKLLPSTAPITAIYYNRALILETLMPRTIALEAWQQYLQQPLSNDQRSIAQRHLEKSEIASLDEIWHTQVQHFTANAINTNTTLTTDIANQQPHNARLYIIEQLLPAWATAVQQSQPQQAAAILKAASRLAQAIPFSVDGQLVREAVSSAQQNATNKLAQGYLALQAGQTLATQSQFGPASTEFKAARDAFDPALYPAVYAYTTMLLAIIEPDPSQAEQYINEVIQISQARNYPYLLGRVWSRRSGIKGREFDIVAAIESQTQAIKYLKQSASWELLAQGYFVMSDVLNQIGEKEDIQQPQLHALEELQKFSYSKYTSRILGGLATQLENLGEFEAATDFHNAAVQLASLRSIQDGQLLDPFAPAFTRLRRSQIHNKTGKNTLAQQDIRDAEAALAALPNSGQKMAFLNNIRLFQAIYYTKTNPQLAIEQLSEFINNPSDKYYLTQMYRSRAQAQRQLGNVSAAIADLQTAIDHFETQRQTVPPFQRIAFTGEARSAYEEMIDLQIEQGNIKEAFRYSEGAKARTLLESIQAGIKTPNPDLISANLALNALQKQLTAQQVVVEYSVVKDNLYAWVVTTTKIDMVRLTPTVSTLVSWNKQLQQRTPAQLPGLLADLYDQLWKPLSSYLPSDAETIIVPDQGVYEIPFAGLFDRQKGQFLMENRLLRSAPSVAVYLSCRQRDRQIEDNQKNGMLLVANPRFSHKLFPNLLSLPQAEAEAREVIRLLNKQSLPNFAYQLLANTTATKQAFLDDLDRYSIVHFAGHTLENEVYPFYSRMIFATPELSPAKEPTREDEVLYAHELYQHNLQHTRLVILAACRTATGRSKSGEGTISLARAFLASGTPTVVASLWDIGDRATAEFSIAFHKELLLGKDPAQALRQAQLRMRHHSDPQLQSPAFWSAFTVLGSNALPLLATN